MSQAELSQRIYADPAFTELARLVGYQGVKYPIPKVDYDRLIEKFGNDRMIKAAAELVDYDTEKRIAKLKLNVRVLCRQLLGPLPEEWDSFYEGMDNPPPNPYRQKPAIIEDFPDAATQLVHPPGMAAEDMIRNLDDDVLAKLLGDAKWALNHYGPKSRQGRLCKRDVAKAEAEVSRRTLQKESREVITEVELLRSMHGRKLRSLLFSQHILLRNYPPGDPTHEEAVLRVNLLERIMRQRGQKIPQRPLFGREHIDVVADGVAIAIDKETGNDCAVNEQGTEARRDRVQNLEGTELMKRYFKAKEILEAESEHTGIYRQTKIEYDLLKAECMRRNISLPPTGFDDPAFPFRQATTHRLKELLDMNQYEVAKYHVDTVTHQEAIRDIGLIERELCRRKKA